MNLIKVNFYRFANNVPVVIDVVQGKNDVNKIVKNLSEIKYEAIEANNASSKIISSITSAKSSSSLKKMRKDLETNIKGAIQEIQNYIKQGNASDKFVVKVKTQMDRYAALEQGIDHRTKGKRSEVTGLSSIQQSLSNAMLTESAKKTKEVEKAQKDLNKAILEEEKERQKALMLQQAQEQEQESLKISVSSGIGMVAKGVNSISSITSSMIKHITGAAVTFRILGGVVSGIIGKFRDLYDTAAGYEEAVNLYRTALGRFAEEADEWRDKISNALHLDPKDVMQYTGALYNLVQGLGVGEEAAYKMAKNMTQLSYDMSSYLNIDVQSAYEKISSAISGQARAVGRVGVAMQVASLQELAYSLGIKKSVNEMTQAEKTYLRYIQLMRSTTKMQQDLGKTILTPENALRVVRAEFIQFARALGQVVIPVVMKVIPYLAALANMLTSIANKIAKSLGYEMAKVDYGNFDTGNSKLKDMSKNLDNVGGSAKKARNEIQRTLAPFDELNVVESESKTGGLGGGAGDDSVLGTLEKYVDEYDMLGKLTGDFDAKVQEAQKNLEKLLPTIKKIAVAFAAWKLIKTGAGIVGLISKFKDGIKAGDGFGSVIQILSKRFSSAYVEAGKFSNGGLGAVTKGFQGMLGTIGTVVASVGLAIGSFTGGYEIMRNWSGQTDDLVGRLVGAGGLTAALAGVAAVIAGPWVAAGVVLAGVIGGLVGVNEKLQEMYELEEYQKRYDTLFDGVGISLNRLQGDLDRTFEPMKESWDKMKPFSDAVVDAKDRVEEARTAIKNLHDTLEYNTYEENVKHVGEIKDAYSTLRDAVIDANSKEAQRQIAQVTRLYEEGRISKQEYDAEVKRIKHISNLRAAQAKGYYQELADLEAKLATNKITQNEYNDAVEKLGSKYALVADTGKDLELNMLGMYDVAKNGFDLENPEKMNEAIEKLVERYNGLKDNVTEVYNTNHDLNRKQIEDDELRLAMLDRVEEKTDSQKQAYIDISDELNRLRAEDEQLTKQYEQDMRVHGATYKDVMLTFLGQIDEAGLTTNSNVENTVKKITDSLDSLKDYNVTDSTAGLFKNYTKSFEDGGKTFSQDAIRIMAKYAKEIGTQFISNTGDAVQQTLNDQIPTLGQHLAKDYGKLSGLAIEGYTGDMNSPQNKMKVQKSAAQLGEDSIIGVKQKLDINSPSRVFEEIGEYTVEGLIIGMEQKNDEVRRVAARLGTTAAEALSKQTLSFNIDTSIEKSLNTILSKLQRFADNWRDAINKCAKGMKTTLNSLKLDKDGKITYEAMPTISVKKFEKGGFPKSGDLFWANENGRSEYITSIGNRAAVANQDQMVSALTNAILTGMSQIPSNTQPSNVTVYVGDKKLYEGQGEYQNRQNDRYGTTVVRI